MAEIVSKRSVSEDGPYSIDGVENEPTEVASETLQLRVPIRNATEWSSNLRGEFESRSSTVNGLESHRNWPPETPQTRKVVVISEPDADMSSVTSTTIASIDQRTPPRKRSTLKDTASITTNGDSSVISGPRKLRVSSIVRKINNGKTSTENLEREKVRRQPPKLMRKAGVSSGATVAT